MLAPKPECWVREDMKVGFPRTPQQWRMDTRGRGQRSKEREQHGKDSKTEALAWGQGAEEHVDAWVLRQEC